MPEPIAINAMQYELLLLNLLVFDWFVLAVLAASGWFVGFSNPLVSDVFGSLCHLRVGLTRIGKTSSPSTSVHSINITFMLTLHSFVFVYCERTIWTNQLL